MSKPTCTIISGVNGAGKTTFALKYLREAGNCQRFINADLIASGLSPLAPELKQMAASRLFLNEIKLATRRRENFSFETTLSGKGYLNLIHHLQTEGWSNSFTFTCLMCSYLLNGLRRESSMEGMISPWKRSSDATPGAFLIWLMIMRHFAIV